MGLCLWMLALLVTGDQAAFVSLTINGEARGDVVAIFEKDDILLPRDAFTADRITLGEAHGERIADREMMSLRALAPKVKYVFDQKNVALALTVDSDLFPEQVITLRTRPEHMEYREATSAFLNYALSLRDFNEVVGYGEAGFSFHGGLLYSSASFDTGTGYPVRGLTNYTIDDKPNLRRWIVGDNFLSTGDLGGGAFVAGATVQRNFDIDPYFARQPMLGFAGAALTPSTVDVYVNDVLVRRESVAPGTFRLDNLPGTTGSSQVRYVIHDAFGNTQELSQRVYFAPQLLREGLSDYGYTVGVVRNNMDKDSFDYGRPVAMAYHRYGVTNWLTADARLEAGDFGVSGGTGAAVRTSFGEARLAWSLSGGDAFGYAASLAYSYTSRAIGAGFYARVVSPHYATASTDAAADRATLELTGFLGVPIGHRLSMGAEVTRQEQRDSGRTDHFALTGNVTISSHLAAYFSASYGDSSVARSTVQAFASLRFTFGDGWSAGASGQVLNSQVTGSVDLQKALPINEGFGFHSMATFGASPTISQQVQYQGEYGHYSGLVNYQDGITHTQFDIDGGVAFVAGGGLFATRSLRDGFALLQVPGVAGVRGFLENLEMGKTSSSGNLIIPNLLAYYGNRISVADGDVPMDRALANPELRIAPPFRGGVLVRFGEKRVRFVRGTLHHFDGREVEGPIVISDEGEEVKVRRGRGAAFEFDTSHSGVFVLRAEKCRALIVIPEKTTSPIVRVGEATCAKE